MGILIYPFGYMTLDGKIKEKFTIEKALEFFSESKNKEELIKKFGEDESHLNSLQKIAIENSFFKNKNDLIVFLNKFFIDKTRKELSQSFTKDTLLIQASLVEDDLTEKLNILYERIMEWFGFFYPEAAKELGFDDVEKISSLNRDKISEIMKKPKSSMGIYFDEDDKKALSSLLAIFVETKKRREELLEYMDKTLELLAPNLKIICGTHLACKLISKAGSMKNLAQMATSTIQVIGAEKALFRHLREGALPPKHGIILQHDLLAHAPKNISGKVARVLASKISLSAKVDFYSTGKKEIVADKYLEQVRKVAKGPETKEK